TKAVSPSRRRKNLRRRLEFELTPLYKGKKPEYEQRSDMWVTDLRKAYEQLIEEYVLAGVVRRWNQNVRVRQLLKIRWTPELGKRIEEAMKELAPKAHHEAVDLYPR